MRVPDELVAEAYRRHARGDRDGVRELLDAVAEPLATVAMIHLWGNRSDPAELEWLWDQLQRATP